MPEIYNGIIQVRSLLNVDRAMDRLQELVCARGLLVFARIDFALDAKKNGLAMRPTQLLVFGHPKAGTPLMQDAPSTALDLPLKVLVAQDGEGLTWYSYNDPAYLQTRHQFAQALISNIAGIASLVEEAARS